MSRKQPDLPGTDEGHSERLRRAVKRSQSVLNTRLAQDPIAPSLGTVWYLATQKDLKTGAPVGIELRRNKVDRAQLDQAAALTRVFTLPGESIYGPKVVRAIARFAVTDQQKFHADQLQRMWEEQPFSRTYAMPSVDGSQVAPPGGISDSAIADRVLYSEIVHADEASAVLEHISDDEREWSLSCLVGDRLALVSHQEWLISSVRPDICPSPTTWAGDHITIIRRLGGRVEGEGSEPVGGDQAAGSHGGISARQEDISEHWDG